MTKKSTAEGPLKINPQGCEEKSWALETAAFVQTLVKKSGKMKLRIEGLVNGPSLIMPVQYLFTLLMTANNSKSVRCDDGGGKN